MYKYNDVELSKDDIFNLLSNLGCCNIKEYPREFKFSWYEGANPMGSCLFKKNMRFHYWSKNISGDILDLIQHKLGCTYSESKQIFKNITNKTYKKSKNTNIYLSYLSELSEKEDIPIYDYSFYTDNYPSCFSKLLMEDGIGLYAQSHFDIRFDEMSNRICFPVRDLKGNLVGVLGRYNEKDVPNTIAKYLPLVLYEKRYILFGAYENRDYIKDTLILVESEKSVIKAFSMGYRNVVALGGVVVNEHKLQALMQIAPKRVILALDEGIRDDIIKDLAKRLISPNPFIKWHVGYIPSNDVGLGRKNCIFDESKEICYNIINDKVNYIC